MDQDFYLDFDEFHTLSAIGQLTRPRGDWDYVKAFGIRHYYDSGIMEGTEYHNYAQVLDSYSASFISLTGQTVANTYPTHHIVISDNTNLTFAIAGIALLYVATEGDDRLQWCVIWSGSDNQYYMQRVSVKTDALIGSVISGSSMERLLGDNCIAYLLWNSGSTNSAQEAKIAIRVNSHSYGEIRFQCSLVSGQECDIGYLDNPANFIVPALFNGVIYATTAPSITEIRTELNRGLSAIEDLKQDAGDSFNDLLERIDKVSTSLSSDFVAR